MSLPLRAGSVQLLRLKPPLKIRGLFLCPLAPVEPRDASPDPDPPWLRMAIHAGSADMRDGDSFGPALNRTARLLAIGHGGQRLQS